MNLLQMSLSGSVFIIAVIIIRTAAIHNLPKRTFLILWELVLIRLLIPFSVPSMLSVYHLISVFWERKTEITSPSIIQEPFDLTPLQLPLNDIPPVFNWPLIWCIGTMVCAMFFTVFYLRCMFQFRISHTIYNDYVKQWLREHSLKRLISIRQSNRISTPLTYGIFRPVILLPQKTDWQNENRLQYILLHEYVHICRFDTARKLIMIFALCIHWFNPMVWIMYILFNRDIELLCDEIVIRKTGEASKSAYALMLIDMEAKKSGPSPLCSNFNCSNFSINAIEERITAIMKTKKTTIVTMILSCFVILGAAGMFATSAAASTDRKETSFSENDINPEDYAIYEPFGLTAENGKLYFDGKPVRCFDDQIPAANFRIKAIGYYEKNGAIDVRAKREKVNGKNELVGLLILPQEEFENRVIVDHSESVSSTDENLFAVYEEYGLCYDETEKALFYDGKRVRLFWDSRNRASRPGDSNAPFHNSVSNWDPDGEIDLYTVRNFDRTDENGYGILEGFRAATQEEFEINTNEFSDRNQKTETAE